MCVHTLIFHTYLGQLCTLRLSANYVTGTFSTEKEKHWNFAKKTARVNATLSSRWQLIRQHSASVWRTSWVECSSRSNRRILLAIITLTFNWQFDLHHTHAGVDSCPFAFRSLFKYPMYHYIHPSCLSPDVAGWFTELRRRERCVPRAAHTHVYPRTHARSHARMSHTLHAFI